MTSAARSDDHRSRFARAAAFDPFLWLEHHDVPRRRLIIACFLAVLLLVIEWRFAFGSRAPLVASLTADIVLLVFATFVINAVVEARAGLRKRERLDLVGRVMNRALAQVSFDVQRRIDAHLTGHRLEEIGMPAWPPARSDGVRVHLAAVGLSVAIVPLLDTDEERAARLRLLLRRQEWTASLYEDIASFKRHVHQTVGLWAPLLLETPDREAAFEAIKAQADELDVVQKSLYDGAATTVPVGAWVAVDEWVDLVVTDVLRAFSVVEATRELFHLRAKELRPNAHPELQEARAVTSQAPRFDAEARIGVDR